MIESVIALVGNFILPYLVLSLLAMLLAELIAALAQLRGLTLRRFIQRMLGDPNGKGIARDFYRHHLIGSLSLGKRLPSYIPARLFAIALVDIVTKHADDGCLSQGIQRMQSQELGQGMRALIRHAVPGRELSALELWYSEVMDAASGAYRLRTLFLVMTVAIAMVIPVNLDAVRISNHVARHSLMERIVESRLQAAAKAATKPQSTAPSLALPDVATLQGLAFPMGWSSERTELRAREATHPDWLLNWLLMKIVGLLTSIFAIMIGASFLFDLLNRFMVVRSTVKPWEKWPEPEATAQPVAIATPAAPPPRATYE